MRSVFLRYTYFFTILLLLSRSNFAHMYFSPQISHMHILSILQNDYVSKKLCIFLEPYSDCQVSEKTLKFTQIIGKINETSFINPLYVYSLYIFLHVLFTNDFFEGLILANDESKVVSLLLPRSTLLKRTRYPSDKTAVNLS